SPHAPPPDPLPPEAPLKAPDKNRPWRSLVLSDHHLAPPSSPRPRANTTPATVPNGWGQEARHKTKGEHRLKRLIKPLAVTLAAGTVLLAACAKSSTTSSSSPSATSPGLVLAVGDGGNTRHRQQGRRPQDLGQPPVRPAPRRGDQGG